MLPLLRTMLLGGALAALALLAGFTAPAPSTLARPIPPARGPLIETAQHPEWKQFLVQAAYRRADELDKLRALPNTPTVMPDPPDEPPVPTVAIQIAALPPPQIEAAPEEVTGSIDEPAPGDMDVGVGEASAVELPVGQDLRLPPQRPEMQKPPNETRHKPPAHRVVKRAAKPAPAKPEPDFFTRLFGGGTTDSSATTPQKH